MYASFLISNSFPFVVVYPLSNNITTFFNTNASTKTRIPSPTQDPNVPLAFRLLPPDVEEPRVPCTPSAVDVASASLSSLSLAVAAHLQVSTPSRPTTTTSTSRPTSTASASASASADAGSECARVACYVPQCLVAFSQKPYLLTLKDCLSTCAPAFSLFAHAIDVRMFACSVAHARWSIRTHVTHYSLLIIHVLYSYSYSYEYVTICLHWHYVTRIYRMPCTVQVTDVAHMCVYRLVHTMQNRGRDDLKPLLKYAAFQLSNTPTQPLARVIYVCTVLALTRITL